MNRPDTCDNCKRRIDNGDHVTVIIPNVEVSTKTCEPDTLHLKLSKFSLTTRAMKIYCRKCLPLENYIHGDDNA